jgi:hypothetical protein
VAIDEHPSLLTEVSRGQRRYAVLLSVTDLLVVAVALLAAQAEIDRTYLLVGFALGWALLLLSRWLWRRWLLSR